MAPHRADIGLCLHGGALLGTLACTSSASLGYRLQLMVCSSGFWTQTTGANKTNKHQAPARRDSADSREHQRKHRHLQRRRIHTTTFKEASKDVATTPQRHRTHTIKTRYSEFHSTLHQNLMSLHLTCFRFLMNLHHNTD